MRNFDEKLVKKSYGLISKKYSTENGKKFILHLISSFVINGHESATVENSNKVKELECCISRCPITPIGIPVPLSIGRCYYGYVSSKSDKLISYEAYEALKRFIDYRLSSGDDIISRIKSYMEKENKKKSSDKVKKPYVPKNKQIKESKASYEEIEALPKPTV